MRIMYSNFKKIFIFVCVFSLVIMFLEISNVKVKAEGWVNVDNSWRYYSGPDIKTGWCKADGNWYYIDESGRARTGWIKSEGKYYYLDYLTGKMLTGWIQDKGNWYYLNSSGEMLIGWLEYNGNLYYLNNSGVMVRDIYIGEYYLGPDGAWRYGSIKNK